MASRLISRSQSILHTCLSAAKRAVRDSKLDRWQLDGIVYIRVVRSSSGHEPHYQLDTSILIYNFQKNINLSQYETRRTLRTCVVGRRLANLRTPDGAMLCPRGQRRHPRHDQQIRIQAYRRLRYRRAMQRGVQPSGEHAMQSFRCPHWRFWRCMPTF